MSRWQRPETTPFPRTYRRFKGKKPMPDGRIADFWVQDATEDLHDDITYHMQTFFQRDEPLSKSINFSEDIDNDEELKKMGDAHLRELLKQRLTVVAMTNWPDGKPQLAGVNLLYYFHKDDRKGMNQKFSNAKMKKFIGVMFLTLDMVNVYEKYGVEEFTTAIGLSVHPTFRGQNVGVELLKARAQMTKAVGLKLTLNNFTGPASQTQAQRAGYELLAEIPYPEVKDEDGEEMFPGIGAKTLQFRVKYVGDKSDSELAL